MNLSKLLASMQVGDGTIAVDVGDDWLQGRSLFGGLQAAIALAAMRTKVAPQMPLRTLQMTFIAPVPSGTVSANARVLREGKNTTHAEARLENSDGLQAPVIGIFGSARASIVHRQPAAPAQITGARTHLPFMPSVTPSFMQQFDVDLLAGALPFSNKQVTHNTFELSLRDDGAMSEAHLLVLADFVPPVALSWMPKVVPGSSLTWMFEVLDEDFAAQPLQGWRVESEMVAAHDGYVSQSTMLWGPDGNAVAISRQSMVVFG